MQVSLVNILIAFAGGLLSFLSPCVLPLVPGYISLMSGVSIDHLKAEGQSSSRRAVMANSLAFNAGLSVIFLALGGTAGLGGAAGINTLWVGVSGGSGRRGDHQQRLGARHRRTRNHHLWFASHRPAEDQVSLQRHAPVLE